MGDWCKVGKGENDDVCACEQQGLWTPQLNKDEMPEMGIVGHLDFDDC